MFCRLPHLLVLLSLSACGTAPGAVEPARSARADFADPLAVHRDRGFITGPPDFPAVGRITLLPGAADSALAIVALSIPNSSLRFERTRDGFVAEYDVSITVLTADSAVVRSVDSRQQVKVRTFSETERTDESVIFQQSVMVPLGRHRIDVTAGSTRSSRGLQHRVWLDVASYGTAGVSQPLIVYEGSGRTSRGDVPDVVVNPRSMVPYGGESPRAYMEAWGSTGPVRLHVLTEDGDTVWSKDVAFNADTLSADGSRGLATTIVPIPASVLPIGPLHVHVSAQNTAAGASTPLMMAISEDWMVASFDEMLRVLRYIATTAELDSLRSGTGEQRRHAWQRFWQRRDPLSVTSRNEYRDAFFRRVRHATIAFRESGLPGWATDRGEVYIVLGAPESVLERQVGALDITNAANAEEWIYTALPGGRVVLLFHDRTGFGRYELTPGSRADFRAAAERLRPRR